jgi:hypothetical protein
MQTIPRGLALGAGWTIVLMAFAGAVGYGHAFQELFVPFTEVEIPQMRGATNHLLLALFTSMTVIGLSQIALAVLLFLILRPFVENWALWISFLRAIHGVFILFAAMPVLFVIPVESLIAPTVDQIRQILEGIERGIHLGAFFLGIHAVLLGVWLLKIRVVPKGIGLMVLMSGLAYLGQFIGSSLHIVLFQVTGDMRAFGAFAMILGELFFGAWLLIIGIRRY